jgi:glycosyltransferase involved in cell wall biosynthesis
MVCHYYPPHVGGVEVVAQAHAASAAHRGDQVTVLTSRAAASSADMPTPGISVVRAPAWNGFEEHLGIPFPLFGLRFLCSCARVIRRSDVVHLHDVFYLSSQLAGLLAILFRRPMVITQHVGIVDHPSRLVVFLQRLIYETFGRILFRRACAIIVYNSNVARTVRRYAGSTPVHEVRNGVNTAVFTPCCVEEKIRLRRMYGLPTDRPIALYAGRLVPKKGYDLLFHARCADFLTVFVGDGNRPDNIKEDNDARFFGSVDRSTLLDFYRLSDLFVLPTTGELFTLSMQEAMACGLPVVVANDPGYANYDFDRTSVVLVERNPVALRLAILSILHEEDRRAKAANYVREFTLRDFDWNTNIAKQLALYDSTCCRSISPLGSATGSPAQMIPCSDNDSLGVDGSRPRKMSK